jgi:hypothetical protein
MPGYQLLASPTLYPGQTVRAAVAADGANQAPINCQLYIRTYGANDELLRIYGPRAALAPGANHDFTWRMGETDGAPIAEIGLEISAQRRADGSIYLDFLTWDGAPDVAFTRPQAGGTMWRRAWVDGVDQYDPWWPEPYRIVQNHGTGLLIQGTRDWTDYQVSAAITPHMATAAGLAARVQGMRRYYGLLLCADGKACLVKAFDGDTVLAEIDFMWSLGNTYALRMQVVGTRIQGWIDDRLLFDVTDASRPLHGGGVALICTEGRMATDAVTVRPAG